MMPRRGNFGAERRQKEIKRKQKAESKMERRRAKKERAAGADQPEGSPPSETPDGPSGEDATGIP
jgi:hypothetical protein